MRIVIKVGSSSLTDSKGYLDPSRLSVLSNQISKLYSSGKEVILVSSGAVAAGAAVLGIPTPVVATDLKQASAAVGQTILMHAWQESFSFNSINVAQVLLTKRDFSLRESYKNALQTLVTLLSKKIVPIINENDTVKHRNNAFSDNDLLAALVSGQLHADKLIILTDIDGIYDSDPRSNPSAKRLDKIDIIDASIKNSAKSSGSSLGTGGMEAKVLAAELALNLGVKVFIGRTTSSVESLDEIVRGSGQGSYIGSDNDNKTSRKYQWIAFHSEVKGRIMIDEGAIAAILNGGKSLLPAGVVDFTGNFNKDDVIEVRSPSGDLVGKGISNYSSTELRLTKGKSTHEIKKILEIKKLELIHRDDWIAFL